MKAEDKAKDLINKCAVKLTSWKRDPKVAALLIVEEILELHKGCFMCDNPMFDEKYWREVRNYINDFS